MDKEKVKTPYKRDPYLNIQPTKKESREISTVGNRRTKVVKIIL